MILATFNLLTAIICMGFFCVFLGGIPWWDSLITFVIALGNLISFMVNINECLKKVR